MTTFAAMNTGFLLAGQAAEKADMIEAAVQSAQNLFSRFKPASDITLINNNAGQWTGVQPLTLSLLQDVINAYQETDGIFNPFLGETIKLLGYNKSFEMLPRPADLQFAALSPEEITPPPKSDFRPVDYLILDESSSQVFLAEGVSLDLGGIAKGWIAQHICDRLLVSGVKNGLIDAGGDIILWGSPPEQPQWGIGVSHPLAKDQDIASLWCEGTTAIATSSVVKRRWLNTPDSSLHHIIDPRTQSSANSDLIQVSVLARDLAVAEEYAKCLIILGSKIGPAWLKEKRAELGFIAVRNDGSILTSHNLHQYCIDLEVLPHAGI